jgi:hypothetical protein
MRHTHPYGLFHFVHFCTEHSDKQLCSVRIVQRANLIENSRSTSDFAGRWNTRVPKQSAHNEGQLHPSRLAESQLILCPDLPMPGSRLETQTNPPLNLTTEIKEFDNQFSFDFGGYAEL